MTRREGEVVVKGTIAYASQNPWSVTWYPILGYPGIHVAAIQDFVRHCS